ncbi:DUF6397 family protein [Nonomuraea sp. NPDC026600]|uniref:DUF6397 family protein n=1 Tax=Nonomuraea sp. NPDC026600 TaxID=3155363 RepID=UPI0033D624B0
MLSEIAKVRKLLGLEVREFEAAILLRAVTVVRREGARLVSAEQVEELLADLTAFRARIELVYSASGAELLGVTQDRFNRLARVGLLHPVRWYENSYKVPVWLYSVAELRRFDRPELLNKRLPTDLLRALQEGVDLRYDSWWMRVTESALGGCATAWERAAFWLAVHGLPLPQGEVESNEFVHLGRLGEGLHVDPLLGRREVLAEFRRALSEARTEGPAPSLLSAVDGAALLGCRPEVVPRKLTLEVAQRWQADPPRWLRSARLDAMAAALAVRLGVPTTTVRPQVRSGLDPEAAATRWTTKPPAWLVAARKERELADAATVREQARAWGESFGVHAHAVPHAVPKLTDAAVADAAANPPAWLTEAGWTAEHGFTLPSTLAQLKARRRKQGKELAQRLNTWARAFQIPVESVPDTVPQPGEAAYRSVLQAPPDWLLSTGWLPGQGPAAAREQAARAKQDRRRRDGELQREAAARARARITVRARPPEQVRLHLGPTNSGKTHDSVEFLIERAREGFSGTYAAPLRMLAGEVYERLVARLGPELVGLRTGEERVNADAQVLCCTAEAVPSQGSSPGGSRGVLVVDEAHWLADRDRGHAWTRLLLTGDHRFVHVTGAPETEPLLRRIFADAEHLEVVRHMRAARLTLTSTHTATSLPDTSAVVAFSRRAVLALHRELVDAGRTATVLYGAMPPGARREQIRRLVDGEVEVIVTTDVIGHGINLPLRAVVFAETTKFDGVQRRPLRVWEAAQIAGRAGRRGLQAGDGLVAGYQSRIPGFTRQNKLMAAAVDVANGDTGSDLAVHSAPLRPVWADLGEPLPAELPHALTGWSRAAKQATAELSWLAPMPVDDLHGRWEATRAVVGAGTAVNAPWPREGRPVWRLLTLPVDADAPAFRHIVLAVLRGRPATHLLKSAEQVARMPLADAEQHAALMRDLRIAVRAFPEEGVGEISENEATAGEEAAAGRIVELLARGGPLSTFGVCASCGKPCAPWFRLCDPCHGSRFSPWDEE